MIMGNQIVISVSAFLFVVCLLFVIPNVQSAAVVSCGNNLKTYGVTVVCGIMYLYTVTL